MSFETEMITLTSPYHVTFRIRKISIAAYGMKERQNLITIYLNDGSSFRVIQTMEEIDVLMGKKAQSEND